MRRFSLVCNSSEDVGLASIMASKARASARLESDIQVARDDSNWRKAIELAEQLKTRSPNLGKYDNDSTGGRNTQLRCINIVTGLYGCRALNLLTKG